MSFRRFREADGPRWRLPIGTCQICKVIRCLLSGSKYLVIVIWFSTFRAIVLGIRHVHLFRFRSCPLGPCMAGVADNTQVLLFCFNILIQVAESREEYSSCKLTEKTTGILLFLRSLGVKQSSLSRFFLI